MSITNYQTTPTSNDPVGSDFMDSTASGTYLVTELQTLKADARLQSLTKPWITLVGLKGSWTGSVAWTEISGTQASVQGDHTVASGTGYLAVGQRVRAFVTAGTIYGFISVVSVSASVTTVTFVWDSGSLDSGLTDVQTGGDINAIANQVVSQSQVPLYCVITNGGSGVAFTGTLAPAIAALVAGQEYRVKWTQANGGADTVNLNAIGAKTVKKNAAGALASLAAGDIPAGSVTNLLYDGTNFQLTGSVAGITVWDRLVGNPAVDVVNSTTETTIYTKSIPAKLLGTDGALRLTFIGDFLNNSGGTVGITFKVKFGGTTVLTGQAQLLTLFQTGANRNSIRGHALIANLGAANLQQVEGGLVFGGGANGNMGGGTAGIFPNGSVLDGQYTGLAIDTTAAQTLAVTVQNATMDAAVEFRLFALFVELIQP